MDNLKGNLFTIIKFIVLTISPAVGVDAITGEALVSVISAVVGFLIAYIDAENPNNFKCLGNDNTEVITDDNTA